MLCLVNWINGKFWIQRALCGLPLFCFISITLMDKLRASTLVKINAHICAGEFAADCGQRACMRVWALKG